MKKFLGSIKGDRRSKSVSTDTSTTQSLPKGDGPDAVVVREITAFCESGAPNSPSAGDEYLHLPAIVDAAESSPTAAKQAALTIQRYLSKQNYSRGYAQYNAIMLTRILTDNPGRHFTQHFDKSFVSTVKELLKDCKDGSVQQITRETLDHFEADKVRENDTLIPLIEMWKKQKGPGSTMNPMTSRHSVSNGQPPRVPQQSRPRGLPSMDELVARIEEAKISARLLIQMVQSTPQADLPNNDLVREFAERTREAHKSIQMYMACENPSPDDATMMTLIETSEQLNIAMTKHQRALLQARKALGQATPSPQPQSQQQDPFNTAALNSALPPQQTEYLTALQPARPQQQETAKAPSSSIAELNTFTPPPGPPPSRQAVPTTTYLDYTRPVSTNNSPSAPYSSPPAQTHGQPQIQSYDIPHNPFSDDMYATSQPLPHEPEPQTQELPAPSAYDRFHSAAAINNRIPLHDRTATAELDANPYPTPTVERRALSADDDEQPHRPEYAAAYGGGPTQSFMVRQESSADHVNMSGASR